MVSVEDLRQTARLAALDMDDAALQTAADEMTAILALVDCIELCGDADISVTEANGVLRDDAAVPSLTSEALLQNALHTDKSCFVYPNRKVHDV